MRDFKFLIYCWLIIHLNCVGLLADANENNSAVLRDKTVANSTEATSTVESEQEKVLFTLTPEVVKERQQTITKLIKTLQKESVDLKKEEQAFQKQLADLPNLEQVNTEQIEAATKRREEFSHKLEELRLERTKTETNLNRQHEQLTQLTAEQKKLQQLPTAKQTKKTRSRQSELKQNLALLEKAIATEEQYLALLKEQNEIALNITMLAIEWHLQLQVKQNQQLIDERKQAVVSAQTMLQEQEQALLTIQEDMPNRLSSLQTTETTADQLQSALDKATLEKEAADVKFKNLRLEQQNIESNLTKQSQSLEELQQEIETLKKSPPTEREQLPLHGKRVAELENRFNSQTQIQQLEKESLSIISQQVKQAEKELEITTKWYNQLVPIFQTRQRQELEAKLQQEKQQHLSNAVELRWQLNKLPTSQEHASQRYLLQIQIQQANEKAEQLGRTLKIQHVKEQLQSWREQLSEEKQLVFSTGQVEKFQTWMDELNIIINDLDTIQTALKDKLIALDKQQKLVEQIKAGLAAEQLQYNDQAKQLLTELTNTLQKESKSLAPLLAESEQLLTVFKEKYRKSVQLALFRQRQLPTNIGEWQTLLKEIITLPNIFMQKLQLTWRDFKQVLEQVEPKRWLIIGVSGLIWLIIIWLLWLKARTPSITSLSGGVLTFLSRFFQANILTIATVGLLLLLLWLIEFTPLAKQVIFILLLIGIISKLLISLSRLLLLNQDMKSTLYGILLGNRDKKSTLSIELYRQLRWITIVIAILAVIIALMHIEYEEQTLKLSLMTQDFVDSLFMLFLSLIILPLLKARRVIFIICNQVRWCTVASFIILAIAFIVAAVSLLGLIGYPSLGWSVANKLSFFLLVLLGWIVVHGFLIDIMKAWKNRALRDEDEISGSLWVEDIIPVVEKILSVILIVLTILVFLKITGWYSDVAFKQNAERFFSVSLFTIGTNKLTIGSILLSIFLLWIIFRLGSWSRSISYRWAFSGISDSGIRHSLSVFTQYIIIILGLLIVLKGIGIDPTVLSVFMGALGVGLGFGLQNVTNNFISGILLLVERPVRTGDFITIGNFTGTVTHIGIRSLTLSTVDRSEAIVPNSEVISQSFINLSKNDNLSRDLFYIGIHYDSDLELAPKIIKQILEQHEGILKKYPHNAYLSEVTEFKINIRIDYVIDFKNVNRNQVRSDVISQIVTRFKEAGIKMPQQTEIYLNSPPQSEIKEKGNLIMVAT
jgi:potassium efflux system protein